MVRTVRIGAACALALGALGALGACGDNLRPAVDEADADAAAVDAAASDARVDGAPDDAPTLDAPTLDAPLIDGATDDGAPALDAGEDARTCAATVASFPLEPGAHVAQCTPISYATNPPTSGPHYPLWARFKAYADRVPRGFWVHAMEHGAVVVTYNCPGGCAADVAALIAYLDARPADPLCTAPVRNRFIVTPDPLLDTTFAASAWGWSLRADCFDLPALGAFIDAHYAQAPENFCSDGFDPTAPGSGVPGDCP